MRLTYSSKILLLVTLIIFGFLFNLSLSSGSAADLPDLDVTYIERTPRYNRYRVEYKNHLPYLAAIPTDPDQNPFNDKHWPDPGEQVNWIAHIINKGNAPTGQFSFKWKVDGQTVASGGYSNLNPGEEGTQPLSWPWPNNLDDHTITFLVDEENNISEIAENNNRLEEYTNSLSFSIFVEEKFYDLFNQTKNGFGTYSFEDWLQWQFSELKKRFKEAKYPLTPQGIKERIRIDRIVIVPFDSNNLNNWQNYLDNDSYLWQTDGRWQFVADYNKLKEKEKHWQNYLNEFSGKIDDGLLHELIHQLGIIDDYRFAKANDPENHNRIFVTDRNGNYVDPEWTWECQGLMGGDSTFPYCQTTLIEDHAAFPLNLHLHQRRGFYGDYLYDTPKHNLIKVIDQKGNPLQGVSVALYQKEIGTEIIDNTPEYQGTTNKDGLVYLTNHSAPFVSTATGHSLKNNPFGLISVVGENGSFLVKVSTPAKEEFHWLTLRSFNLAYWKGKKDEAVFEIKTNLSQPPLVPTSTPTPTITPTPSPECPKKSQGDANCDGKITLLDFEIWREEAFDGKGTTDADFNRDGTVNNDDYQIWQSNFS